MAKVTKDICWTCDGSGRVRANVSKNGKYMFAKKGCDACNGTGQLTYRTCPDCNDVVPVDYFHNHECDD